MQRVTFTNARGEMIELYQSPFFLNRIEGLGGVDADFQTQKAPGQDGSTYISGVLAERSIPIEVMIHKDLQPNRRVISRIFNPKLGPGLLTYENNIGKWQIMAVPDHVPTFFDERPRLMDRVQIDLVCHDPYWTTEEQVEQMVLWEGGFEFPFQLPDMFAQRSPNKSKIIENQGGMNTPIFIKFEGPATAPIRVSNLTTGEFIEVNQNLLAGEVVEINTSFGQKKVSKVAEDGSKTNVFHYINLNSKFFELIPGNNLLDYSTGNDLEDAGVTIIWRNRYMGI